MEAPYRSRAWQTPADSRRMQALVANAWLTDWPRMHLHAGDVDWWSVHVRGQSPGMEERVRLWFAGEPDATDLVGFGWYGPPVDVDLVAAAEHRGPALYRAMVEWVDDRVARYGAKAPGRLGGLDRDAIENDPGTEGGPGDGPAPIASPRLWTVASERRVVDALAGLGFAPSAEPGFVHFARPMTDLVLEGPPIAAGYRLETIRTDEDIAGRVATGHAAFPGSTMTVEKYRFCRSTPLYRPGLDLTVRAPDGSVAAFALGWLDPLSLGVELEPVGVHPDHRRRGLGSAVCRAVLLAAHRMGGDRALIAAEAANPAANGLYASLGLRVEATIVALRRPGPAGPPTTGS